VASPNPAPGGAARIAFSAPVNALSARLDIFDASGRSVRALPAAALAGRSGSLHWDGRDDAGRAVPAGNYFLRLTAGGESATERVTVLR
jgi:flagellar basal-body rod modification protein FlgD